MNNELRSWRFLPGSLDNTVLSVCMDHIRWFSAFLVLIGHIRQILFVDFSEIIDPNLFDKLFYISTRYSHQAVIAFFVLSGVLVGGKFADKKSWDTFDYPRYFMARLIRLYVVLLPAILFTVLLTVVVAGNYVESEIQYPTLNSVLLNMVYLQEVMVPALQLNAPLWSLTNEFWYYILTPLLVLATTSKVARVRFAVAVLVALLLFMFLAYDQFTEKNVLLYYPVWMLGVILHFRLPFVLPFFVTVPTFVITLSLSRMPIWGEYFLVRDYIFAIAFTSLLISIRDRPMAVIVRDFIVWSKQGAVQLSQQSYSLYLVHYPFCVFVGIAVAFEYKIKNLHPTIGSICVFILFVLSSYALAQLFYVMFESRTKIITTLLGVSRRPAKEKAV